MSRNSLKTPKLKSRFEKISWQIDAHAKKVYQQITQGAATEIPVLLIGETGTGERFGRPGSSSAKQPKRWVAISRSI